MTTALEETRQPATTPAAAVSSVPASAAKAEPQTGAADRAEVVERALIDASTRGPVLMLFGSAIAWLLVATLLAILVSLKLHKPELLADYSFLTYGRLQPAMQNAFVYGWCSLVGMGVTTWLMARLCRVSLRAPGTLAFGVVFWNVGLVTGIGALLAGLGRSVEMMEMPVFAHAIMFVGFALIGLWGAVLYRYRRGTGVFISVWYLLGALFWFPWLIATANLLLQLPQVRGVMHPIIGAWYAQNLNGWWFTGIGLAAAYFLIPKVIRRPIYSYNVAILGFWSFAFFSGLTGMVRLSGGPVPAWLVTLSIAASIMMLIPVATVAVNLLTTMHGRFNMVYHSPTVRFVVFGVLAFLGASLLGIYASLRNTDRLLHFTTFAAAHQQMLLYSFFSMVSFGAMYYITPRLVGCEWLSSTMISVHFWSAAYGGSLLAILMLCASIAQGAELDAAGSTFSQVISVVGAYYPGISFVWFIVAIGHGTFALHFLLMLLRIGQPAGEPTLFAPLEEEGH